MKYVVYDFETASRADLQKVGAWKYASDLSTFPLCLSLKVFVDRKPQSTRCLSERQIHALDAELVELCNDPNVIFIAHNQSFESAMWVFHMVPIGYPPLSPERCHDTMAVCAMKALPLGLDAVILALQLPVKKDMEGHALMMKMCKPDKDGGWSQHTPENLDRLYAYCNRDVEGQAGLFHATGGLGNSERAIWVADQKIQQRGILTDTKFIHACIDVLNQVRIPMTERFRELTGFNPTQREKVLNWVNDQGVGMGDMKKSTLDGMLDPDDEFEMDALGEPLPPNVYEVLKLRRSLASSSVAKLDRMLMCAGVDGRVRYTTQYHGSRTGRDAGRLMQIQNYPRGEISDRQGLTADILADAIMTRDLPTIRELWGEDIFTAVISSLRSCIIPEPGKVLCGGDYAGVEARNLLSMAGQHDRVDQMHAGVDVYAENASLIFKRPINRKVDRFEGQVGKNCLSADTLVLTDHGWKYIIKVQIEDRLWDGLGWVTHKGLEYRGWKETFNLSGLRLTADHLVFNGETWSPADAQTKWTFLQALAYAKGHGPLKATPIPSAGFLQGLYAGAIAGLGQLLSIPTISKGTQKVMSVLLRPQLTNLTSEKLATLRLKSNGFENVYDLADAGLHHRFMVMTCDGPLIVHNSTLGNGYGLGALGFQMRFAPKHSLEFAGQVINSYRKDFAPMVPKFWYGLFKASVDAVHCEMAKTYSFEGIEFRKEGDFLSMRLPSGRKIWYHRPRKAITYTPDGDERESWTFMSYQGKKFRRHLAWHGMITADCIQGSARCMIMGAMLRGEKAGLKTIFKVHDELVYEETNRPDLALVVKQIMEDFSAPADRWVLERKFKVKAEVEVMTRYKK